MKQNWAGQPAHHRRLHCQSIMSGVDRTSISSWIRKGCIRGSLLDLPDQQDFATVAFVADMYSPRSLNRAYRLCSSSISLPERSRCCNACHNFSSCFACALEEWDTLLVTEGSLSRYTRAIMRYLTGYSFSNVAIRGSPAYSICSYCTLRRSLPSLPVGSRCQRSRTSNDMMKSGSQ